MICSKCGKTLKPSAKFCAACGTAVSQPSEPVWQTTPVPPPPQAAAFGVCPKCGEKIRTDKKFCSSCGTLLAATTAFRQNMSQNIPQGAPQTATPGAPQMASPGAPQMATPGAPQMATPGMPQAASRLVPQSASPGVLRNVSLNEPQMVSQNMPQNIPQSVEGNICPRCGAELGSRKFCPQCNVKTVKVAAGMLRKVMEHTVDAYAAPGEVRVSMESVGGNGLMSFLGSMLK